MVVGVLVKTVLVVATTMTVSHAYMMVSWTSWRRSPAAAMIPGATAVVVPAVTAIVAIVEVRTTEIVVVAIGVAGIDAEVPVTCVPVEGAIEVAGCAICCILPIEQNITEVKVTMRPVGSIQVVVAVDTHQIIEVYLVGGLVLILCEVQLVCHLVRKEQGLLTCLLVAHGIGRYCHHEQRCQGKYKLLHNCMYLRVNIQLLPFHVAKLRRK